ncbi:hypothetical protein HGRIS_014846 [Hohenbuehelia grisea]|uniref:Uncharacterized protein n=1 Tax=Hohenbuehelia grisea TaxID=104357 RepID=A0ABR3IQX0_9AGAR
MLESEVIEATRARIEDMNSAHRALPQQHVMPSAPWTNGQTILPYIPAPQDSSMGQYLYMNAPPLVNGLSDGSDVTMAGPAACQQTQSLASHARSPTLGAGVPLSASPDVVSLSEPATKGDLARLAEQITSQIQAIRRSSRLQRQGTVSSTDTDLGSVYRNTDGDNDETPRRKGKKRRTRTAAETIASHEVRQFALEILGRESHESPVPPPPTFQEISDFMKGRTKGPEEVFKLDLDHTITSAWNKCATRAFQQAFLAVKDQRNFYTSLGEAIERAFKAHYKTIQRQCNQQTGKISTYIRLCEATRVLSGFPSISITLHGSAI